MGSRCSTYSLGAWQAGCIRTDETYDAVYLTVLRIKTVCLNVELLDGLRRERNSLPGQSDARIINAVRKQVHAPGAAAIRLQIKTGERRAGAQLGIGRTDV